MGKFIDLTGQRFNHLTVLEQNGRDNQQSIMWKCQCDCGNIITVRGRHLKNGHTKSCGCLSKQFIINLINKQFGKLKVLKYQGSDNNRNALWLCQCDCGNQTIVGSNHLQNGHAISCGCIKSKGEYEIIQYLIKNKYEFKSQYIFPDFKLESGGIPRFDFAIFKNSKLKCLIEYNGEQHYISGTGWNTSEHLKNTQNRDKQKIEYCNKNNIPLHIIKYDENIIEKLQIILNNL